MSRKKRNTEINPIRAERLKTLIEREGITRKEFANRISQAHETVSRILNQKQPLTEGTAQDIIKAFPEYRIEWLLGYEKFVINSDKSNEIREAFAEALKKLDSVRECLLRLQKQITEEE